MPYPDIQLPSLPEITLRAMEACRRDLSYRQIGDILSVDAALVTRILALANSSLFGRTGEVHSVEQALLRLGTEQVQTLVLTAALRQVLFELGADQWQQLRDFWRHALTTALMARALATLTRYPSPEEAFTLGLLHNVGELIALKTTDESHREYYLRHHADIAADLVLSWGFGDLAADAMRHQQASPDALQDASHLVKLINLSTRLALSDAAGISATITVFDLNEELTRELKLRIDREVSALADSLNIPLTSHYDAAPAMQTLESKLIGQARVNQVLTGLPTHHRDLQSMLAAATGSLTMLTGLPVLGFAASAAELTLVASSHGPLPDLSIVSTPARGVLSRAYSDNTTLGVAGPTDSVLDRQLLNLLATPAMTAVPIPSRHACPGVMVLGSDTPEPAVMDLVQLFVDQLGQRLDAAQADNLQHPQWQAELEHQQLHRQIHEINNPLTIIRQYLFQLRQKQEDPQVLDNLDVIREELDRAGGLLFALATPDRRPSIEGQPQTSVNDNVRALAELFEESLFHQDGKQLRLEPSRGRTDVAASAGQIRQLLINLIKNAAEAIDDAGTVSIQTAAPVWQNGHPWVELVIADDGPGLPAAVQQQLFQPVVSNKGAGHSGLGLSIVKQLTDDMEGIISCRTGPSGTLFRILLPAIVDEPDH